jgi:hypothetical protein
VEKELKKEREENRILKQRLKTQKEEEAEKKKETTKGMRARWNDDDQRCSKDRAKK